MTIDDIATAVEQEAERQGLTRYALAKRIGLQHVQCVYRLFDRKPVSTDNLLAILGALGMRIAPPKPADRKSLLARD